MATIWCIGFPWGRDIGGFEAMGVIRVNGLMKLRGWFVNVALV